MPSEAKEAVKVTQEDVKVARAIWDGVPIQVAERMVARHREEAEKRIVDWLRSKAETNRSLADMNLPAVSPTIARAKARWCDEAADSLSRGDHVQENGNGE